MAAVRGLRAQGTPLPHNPSLTQTQTLHYAGSEPGLNPIPTLIVFPPLLHRVDIGLPGLRKELYRMSCAESQPSLPGPGGLAQVNEGVDDCIKPSEISGCLKCICTVVTAW